MIHSDTRLYFLGRLLFAIVVISLSFASPAVFAGEVLQIQPIDFGSIELNPAGDTVVLNGNEENAVPVSSTSLVIGGGRGKIILTSPVEEQVTIDYPSSVTLRSSSHNLSISKVRTYSQYSSGFVNLPGNDIPVTVGIGGELVLSGQEDTVPFNGTMTIILTFNVL